MLAFESGGRFVVSHECITLAARNLKFRDLSNLEQAGVSIELDCDWDVVAPHWQIRSQCYSPNSRLDGFPDLRYGAWMNAERKKQSALRDKTRQTPSIEPRSVRIMQFTKFHRSSRSITMSAKHSCKKL